VTWTSFRTDPLAVLEPDHTLALTFWGSGSCPAVPVSLRIISPTVLSVALDSRTGICTADMAPTTSIIALDPKKVNLGGDLTVRISPVATAPSYSDRVLTVRRPGPA
jgi:hypothetical protein